MVWMLLTPPRRAAAPASAASPKDAARRADTRAGEGACARSGASADGALGAHAHHIPSDLRRDQVAPAADRSPAGGDAWVLLGDLDMALFQAGVVSVWLETRPPPAMMYAGGMSALNALLAIDGDALAFRVGWERLRAAHVLAAAALRRAPLPTFLRRNGSLDVTRSLAASSSRAPGLRLLAWGGFVDFAAGAAHTGAMLDEVLHHRATSHALATAVDGAVASGARRVLVPGADERALARHEVVRAVEDARAAGVEIAFLPMVGTARPGVVGYLLPGLGRADRLMRAGREAARRWSQGTPAMPQRAVRS